MQAKDLRRRDVDIAFQQRREIYGNRCSRRMNEHFLAIGRVNVQIIDHDTIQESEVNTSNADFGTNLSGKNTCQTCAQPLLNEGEVEQQNQSYVQNQDAADKWP